MVIKSVDISGDKSITHRALMLGAIAEGKTKIRNYSKSADCMSTISVIRAMGIEVEEISKHEILVEGKGLKGLKKPVGELAAGNSGTTMRLMTGILAGQKFDSVITGDESLSKRPMKRIITPLREMGAEIKSVDDNYPPLEIKGAKLKSIDYNSPVASAQVKSCVLFAGLYAAGETSVTEPGQSRDHTERMLEHMGVKVKKDGLRVSISSGSEPEAREIEVPGDISSAAYFIVAGLLKGNELTIEGVGVNSTRTGMVDVLRRMGGSIEFRNQRLVCNEPVADIYVKRSSLKGVEVTGSDIPGMIDEIPILAVAATQAEGRTVISGAGELRVKESDRISAVCSELSKMGADIQEKKDGMIINGPLQLKGAEVESYGDHRMAMALNIACWITGEKGKIKINDEECYKISFPTFLEVFFRFKETTRVDTEC